MALPYRWQWRFERWKKSLRGLFGGGNEPPRPKLCPACGSLVGVTATRCHECGTSTRFSLAALSKGLSGFIGGHAPGSAALMILNIFMFALTLMRMLSGGEGKGLSILFGMSGEALYRFGESYPPAIYFGNEYWRLVTAMFLHGGLLHIGFNLMVLMDIGPVVEELYGSARYLFAYVVTGVCGFLLSSFRGIPAVGASTALMGLIGVLIAITSKRGGIQMQALRSRLISWVVSIFAIGFLMPGIDNWGHFGGLAAGFVVGKILADRQPINASERRLAYTLGWIAGIALVASFALMIVHFRDLPTGN